MLNSRLSPASEANDRGRLDRQVRSGAYFERADRLPEEEPQMSVQDVGFERPVSWPSNGISEVPFRLYTDPEQYRLEQERIFKGPTWNYLCLAAEIPDPGDWVATTVGEVAIIVARGADGAINAFVNRCAHRGNLLCLTQKGHGKEITCIYHGWSYDLEGKLTGVAFERGVKRQGGMPPEFRKDDHHLQRLQVAELSGLIFGSFDEDVPDLETYLGPVVAGGIRRVMNRPAYIIGRSTQVLPNNWKLYFENTKDTYHASILHAFLTTFRINRLSQAGGINIDESGGNHFSFAKLDYAAEDAEYKAAALRSDTDLKLADNSITELEWVHLGFEGDDEAMTERRLRQGNLVGPAGYISLEDGCVGGFVQRALNYNDDDSGVVMMGGHDAQSQTFRASEAAIRGFWKKYRALTGT